MTEDKKKIIDQGIEKVKALDAYEVTECRWIEELNSEALVCRHRKTGARVFLLSNDDENKVFTIGFRTPPENDTGVPHILEHSVLCGSRKFPAKDPFIELAKGSLNTFLNAMTYPDKTVYPVASCNDKDFQNLMDVYLDGVFHPNICWNDKIMRQEGWHYEIEDADSPIVINGVVYNEMKGEYSQPESLLDAMTWKALFPDTCYGRDSGGDPDHIPELTQDYFLSFYHRYYHPSNSFIYLYGDMDMAEKLAWIDEEYLSEYDYQEVDSHIAMQPPFEAPREYDCEYPLDDEDEEENQTYLSLASVVGTDLDPKMYVAFQILDYALLSAPGAPLKQVLLDAGIGDDVFGGYNSGTLQPTFTVTAKGAEAGQKEEFARLIDNELRRIASDGINRRSLLAGLNYYEFKYRESDYGQFPKGLMMGLQCFDSWLYDGDPLMHLAYADTFRELRDEIDSGYFESLISDYLLDNSHTALIVLKPRKGLTEEKKAAQAAKMAAYKASLDADEIDRLVRDTKELRKYQEEPTAPEILEKIPMLSRQDIDRDVQPLVWEETRESGVTVVRHNFFTSGICYVRLLFDAGSVADEDLPYLGLLISAIGQMNTENYDYKDLTNEMLIKTGGIGAQINTYSESNAVEPEEYCAKVEINAKSFYDRIADTFDLITEIISRTDYSDKKRLSEIIAEDRSRAQMRLMSAGHMAAVERAETYYSESACFADLTSGMSYFRFLEDLDDNFDEKADATIQKLQGLASQIFSRDKMLVSVTADEEGFGLFSEPFENFTAQLNVRDDQDVVRHLVPVRKNEGYMCPAGVQYVAQAGNFRHAGLEYTGALRVLRTIMSYDYLWINLRVKGGAYGCMANFSRSGCSYLVSYRDPHLKRTLETYQGIPDYLRAFNVDEREMTKYIIGTISEMDTPLTPSAKGSRSMTAYLTHVTEETLKRERGQVLDATCEDIQALAPYVEAVLSMNCVCVVGNAGKCREDGEGLLKLENLFD